MRSVRATIYSVSGCWGRKGSHLSRLRVLRLEQGALVRLLNAYTFNLRPFSYRVLEGVSCASAVILPAGTVISPVSNR